MKLKDIIGSMASKLAALALALTCVGTAWGAADTSWYDASQTSFTLTTEAQLRGLAQLVNAGNSFSDKTITLGADIDVGSEEWVTISTSGDSTKFAGIFDGGNHVISNLFIDQSDETPAYRAAGFFGAINGTVKNLKFVNAKVTGVSLGRASDGATINGIAVAVGSMAYGGTIDNVSVENATVRGNRYVAGIVGYAKGTVQNCTIKNVSIVAEPDKLTGSYDNGDKAGGIVGYCNGAVTVKDNTIAGDFDIRGYRDIAGIVGCGGKGTTLVDNSVAVDATVTVTIDQVTGNYGTKTANAGVLVGRVNEATGENGGAIDDSNSVPSSATIKTDTAVAVAQIGTVQYGTLEAATRAYQSGDTIEIIVDASGMTAPEGWIINPGTPATLSADPYAAYVKVADGFYQNAATYDDSTDFYITSKAGLEYFRDLVNQVGTVADTYVSTFVQPATATTAAGWYTTSIFGGKTVHLMTDVDLNNEEWSPIGEPKNTAGDRRYFYGNFNGENHTIRNLKATQYTEAIKTWNPGLFGYIGSQTGQTFSNLTIENVTLVGYDYAGAVVGNAGSNATAFNNCHVTGAIDIKCMMMTDAFVGGIVGIGTSAIDDCSVEGTAGSTIQGSTVGGLAGTSTRTAKENANTVTDSTVTGVTVKSNDNGGQAGGLVGKATNPVTVTGNKVQNVTVSAEAGKADVLVGGVGGDVTASSNTTDTNVTVISDPYAAYVKVADGFYQNAATYAASTDFYITNLNGLKFFRDIVNGETAASYAYFTATGVTGTYPTTPAGIKSFHSNNMFGGRTVHLLADIDLAGEQWISIGFNRAGRTITDPDTSVSASVSKCTFYGLFDAGIYDGEGNLTGTHEISNLDTSWQYVPEAATLQAKYQLTGLFGQLSGGTTEGVKNLTIRNATVVGRNDVGVIAGRSYEGGAKIENCHVIGNVNVNGTGTYVGGLVGECRASIVNSSVDAEAGSSISGLAYVGGLAGSVFQYNPDASVEVSGSSVSQAAVSASYSGVAGVGALVGVTNPTGSYHGNVVITGNEANNVSVSAPNSSASNGGVGTLVGNALYDDGAYAVVADNTVSGTTSATAGGSAVTVKMGAANDNIAVGKAVQFDENGKIKGGVFEVINEELIASGYVTEDNPDTETNVSYPLTIGGPYVAVIYDSDTGKFKQGFKTLAAALSGAADGETITLISGPDEAISAQGEVTGNKTIYITGTAKFNWEAGWLMVGRGSNPGNGTLIFTNATIYASQHMYPGSTGFNISGHEKGSAKKNDGTIIVVDSYIECNYLSNKGVLKVVGNGTVAQTPNLSIYGGFDVAGRPANETESGEDATASVELSNGAYLQIVHMNGLGVGREGKGVVLVTQGSKLEHTTDEAYINIANKGTLYLDATSQFVGHKMNRGGTIEIDATGVVSGTKIFDLSDTSSLEGDVTVKNLVAPMTAIYDADGDVTLMSVAAIVNDSSDALVGRYETLAEAVENYQNGYTIIVVDKTQAIPEGWMFKESGNVTTLVKAVAQIGTTKYETLAAAVEAVPENGAEATTIKMIADEELGNAYVEIPAGKNIILDLNGKTVTSTHSGDGAIYNKGTLTVMGNGTINGNVAAFENEGTLTVENGAYSGINCVYNSGEQSEVVINGGSYNTNGTKGYALYSSGGKVTITGGDFYGWTFDTYSSSVWTSKYAVQCGDTEVSISGGTFTGIQGALECDGCQKVDITGGTFTTRIPTAEESAVDYSGARVNYAILIWDNNKPAEVNISNGTFISNSEWGKGVMLLALANAGTTVNISGGTFTQNVAGTASAIFYNDLVNGTLRITGGTFVQNDSTKPIAYKGPELLNGSISGGWFTSVVPEAYCAADYSPTTTADANGMYTVVSDYEAQIVRSGAVVQKGTLAAMVAATQDGDTVQMLADVTTSDVVLIDKSITLDGDRHKLITSAGRGIRVTTANVEVTIKNLEIPYNSNVERGIQIDSNIDDVSLTLDNVKAAAKDYALLVVAGSDRARLALKDVELTAKYAAYIAMLDDATLAIQNSQLEGYSALNLYGNDVAVTIEDSTLTGVNNASYNAGGWNDFGVIVVGGDTTGKTQECGSGYDITVKNTAIVVDSTNGNGQRAILYNIPCANNAITLENCTVELKNENCTFLCDNGADSVTKLKGTTVYGTENIPDLPEGYCYVDDGDYKLVSKAVAQIGNTGYASLAEALAAAQDGDTVQLLADVSLTERLFVNAGAEPAYAANNRYATTSEDKGITLDLNGKNITSASNIALAGGSLNITGTGTISTSGSGLAPIEVRGTGDLANKRTLTIGAGVTLNGDYGLNVFGSNDAQKNIIDVTVNGTVNGTLFVLGNLTNAENEINIVVNGKVIAPNGTGTDVNVGIALNGNANVTVNNGATVSGDSGIEVRAGNLTVNGGTISATSQEYSYKPNGSGSTTKGAAIAVAQHSTLLPTTATLNGGTLSGTKQIAVTDVNGNMDAVTVKAMQGYTQSSAIPDDYKWVETEAEGGYKLVPKSYVAQIGENKYETIDEAIAAVPTTGAETTITMIANSAEPAVITVASGKNVVLDLNGKTVSYTTDEKNVYFLTNKGTLTVRDTSANAEGMILLTAQADNGYSVENVTLLNEGGTLTLESGMVKNLTPGGLTYAVKNSSNAWASNVVSTFNMTGGVISAPSGDAALRVYQNTGVGWKVQSKNYVNISGGTILDTGIFFDTYLYTVNQTLPADFAANDTAVGCDIDTVVNISGGTINGLIDMKIRHPYNTRLNITGGDFANAKMWVRKVSNEYGSGLASGTLSEPTDPMVYISGGKFAFVAGKAFGLAYDCGTSSWTTYEKPYAVSGGVFNVEVPAFACAEGYIPVANTDDATKVAYPHTVGVAVAQIGTTKYESLADAYANAGAGDTIVLLADITGPVEFAKKTLETTDTITLDLNGKTITAGSTGSTLQVSQKAGLVITDSDPEHNGKIENTGSKNAIQFTQTSGTPNSQRGPVTITGGTISADREAIMVDNGSFKLTINGEHVNVVSSSRDAIYMKKSTCSIQIDSGTITGGTNYAALKSGSTLGKGVNNVTITGGTLTGDTYAMDLGLVNSSIAITDGTLVGGTSAMKYPSSKANFVSGGKFSSAVPETACAAGYIPTAQDSQTGMYTVKTGSYVAQIGDVKYETLQAAVAEVQDGQIITMLANSTEASEPVLALNGSVTLDLNGKTVTANGDIWVKTGSLTVVGSTGSAINSSGYAFYVSTQSIANNVATLTINSSDVAIHGDTCGVAVMSGGVVNLQAGSISSGHCAIAGNGSNAADTTINITGGTVTCDGTAIYHPGPGTLTVGLSTCDGGEGHSHPVITGKTGIEMRAGTLNVYCGDITATAAEFAEQANGSGSTIAGAAVAVSQHSTDLPIGVNISGGTLNGIYGVYEKDLQNPETGADVVIAVTGGEISGTTSAIAITDIASTTENVDAAVSGGSFSSAVPEEYCADGYIPAEKDSETGMYTVKTGSYVAQIVETGVKYETLAEAVAAATAGQTVQMIADVVGQSTVEVAAGKDVTLDLYGHSIEAAMSDPNRHYYVFDNYGTLTLKDTGNGSPAGSIAGRGLRNNLGATMTVYGGVVTALDSNGGAGIFNRGAVTFYGGTMQTNVKGNNAFANSGAQSSVVVNGGRFIVTYAGNSSENNGPCALYNLGGTAIIKKCYIESASERCYALTNTGNITIDPATDGDVTVKGAHGGLAIDAGTATVNGGSFTCTGSYACWITNDGQQTSVTINGGVFIGNGGGVCASVDDGAQDVSDVATTINGGYFNTTVQGNKETSKQWTIAIRGGYYQTAPAEVLLADGYEVVANTDAETKDAYPYMVDRKLEVIAAADGTVELSKDVDAGYTFQRQVGDDEWETVSEMKVVSNADELPASGEYQTYKFQFVKSGEDPIRVGNTVGILHVANNQTNKTTIIGVPWFALGEKITVDSLVYLGNREAGDKISAYDSKANRYWTWELKKQGENGLAWESVYNTTTESTAEAPAANTFELKRGQGLFLERVNPETKPIYLVGRVAEAGETTEPTALPAGSSEKPTWTLVAAPAATDLDLNPESDSTFSNAGSDSIVVTTAGAGVNVPYTYENGKWGRPQSVQKTRGSDKYWVTVRSEENVKIPAGTGFWYLNRGDAKSAQWK